MQEVFSPFTFQQANGTIHGSRASVARSTTSPPRSTERATRSSIVCSCPEMIIRSDEKSIRKFQHDGRRRSRRVIDKAYDVSEQTVKADTAAFYELDKYMVALMDEIAGSTTPEESLPANA